jgi:hypothetical protein
VAKFGSICLATLLLSGLVVIAPVQDREHHGSDTHGPGLQSAAAGGRDASSTAGPAITSLPPVVYVGDNFLIQGSGYTPGSVVNFFVATAGGPINFGPLVPTGLFPGQMMAFLPVTVNQGEGVASVQVVNTDEGHIASNTVVALLQGDAATGLPSVTGINGVGLSPSSPTRISRSPT